MGLSAYTADQPPPPPRAHSTGVVPPLPCLRRSVTPIRLSASPSRPRRPPDIREKRKCHTAADNNSRVTQRQSAQHELERALWRCKSTPTRTTKCSWCSSRHATYFSFIVIRQHCVHTKFEECSFIRYRDNEGVPNFVFFSPAPLPLNRLGQKSIGFGGLLRSTTVPSFKSFRSSIFFLER